VVISIGSGVAVLVTRLTTPPGRPPLRRSRVPAALLGLCLYSGAVGASLLPVLQPFTLRSDTVEHLSGGSQWNAAPSPESSFWGACLPGRYSGLCASGGTAAWGPGLGWILLAAGVGLIVLVVLRSASPRAAPRGPVQAGSAPGARNSEPPA
jgi:hypothetical protein